MKSTRALLGVLVLTLTAGCGKKIVQGPKSSYVATCTSKMDDTTTPVACMTAINGWKSR